MLDQYRMDGPFTGITVIKAKLEQLQCDALLLTFRYAPIVVISANHQAVLSSRYKQHVRCCLTVFRQALSLVHSSRATCHFATSRQTASRLAGQQAIATNHFAWSLEMPEAKQHAS